MNGKLGSWRQYYANHNVAVFFKSDGQIELFVTIL